MREKVHSSAMGGNPCVLCVLVYKREYTTHCVSGIPLQSTHNQTHFAILSSNTRKKGRLIGFYIVLRNSLFHKIRRSNREHNLSYKIDELKNKVNENFISSKMSGQYSISSNENKRNKNFFFYVQLKKGSLEILQEQNNFNVNFTLSEF